MGILVFLIATLVKPVTLSIRPCEVILPVAIQILGCNQREKVSSLERRQTQVKQQRVNPIGNFEPKNPVQGMTS